MKPENTIGDPGHGTGWSSLLTVITTCWVVSLIIFVISVSCLRYSTGLPRLVPP